MAHRIIICSVSVILISSSFDVLISRTIVKVNCIKSYVQRRSVSPSLSQLSPRAYLKPIVVNQTGIG